MSLQLTAGRKMVGCDVRHTDIYAREISGALEHLQEGTRESRPMMGTGHQQQHRTDGWCDVHASQCSLACGHLRLAGRDKQLQIQEGTWLNNGIRTGLGLGKAKWATTSSSLSLFHWKVAASKHIW